jgi:hypothetical protein
MDGRIDGRDEWGKERKEGRKLVHMMGAETRKDGRVKVG